MTYYYYVQETKKEKKKPSKTKWVKKMYRKRVTRNGAPLRPPNPRNVFKMIGSHGEWARRLRHMTHKHDLKAILFFLQPNTIQL